MLTTVVLATLSAGGVGFYLWFLFALIKECKPRFYGHWVRLRVDSEEQQVVELSSRPQAIPRAA